MLSHVASNSGWWLVELNAALCAVLLVGGVGKQSSPGHLVRALHEVLPLTVRLDRLSQVVRSVASVEVGTAVCVLAGPVRVGATVAASVLGVGFIALGTAGWLRHSKLSCGCFGTGDGHALGPANVAAGLVVVAISVANWPWRPAPSLEHRYTIWCLLAATANIVGLTVWAHRQTVRTLLFGYLLAPDRDLEEVVT